MRVLERKVLLDHESKHLHHVTLSVVFAVPQQRRALRLGQLAVCHSLANQFLYISGIPNSFRHLFIDKFSRKSTPEFFAGGCVVRNPQEPVGCTRRNVECGLQLILGHPLSSGQLFKHFCFCLESRCTRRGNLGLNV